MQKRKRKCCGFGKPNNINGSSDLFEEFPNTIHANFKNYQDTILLVDKGEKQVSSTLGHDLMHNHPYAERRFAQAHENLDQLITILKAATWRIHKSGRKH
jgi:diphosphomevalonate decarboxylase